MLQNMKKLTSVARTSETFKESLVTHQYSSTDGNSVITRNNLKPSNSMIYEIIEEPNRILIV